MRFISLVATAALCAATPAWAQDPEPLPSPDEINSADGFTIAGGVGFVPDYEGSDDYRLIPAAALRGKVGGISFTTRGTYLYVDVVSPRLSKVDFDSGHCRPAPES